MNSPQPITTQIRNLNPACLGSQQERDAFADRMLAREEEEKARLLRMAHNAEEYSARMAFADEQAEEVSEGHLHVNTRTQRHE